MKCTTRSTQCKIVHRRTTTLFGPLIFRVLRSYHSDLIYGEGLDLSIDISILCPGAFSSSTAHEVDSRKHVERSRKGKHLGASSDDEGSYQALSVVFQDSSNLREIIFAA